MPIQFARIKDAVDPRIRQTQAFSEYEACMGAGLDAWKWEMGEYPSWFKARIIIWWARHNQVKAHTEYEAARKAKKKKGRR